VLFDLPKSKKFLGVKVNFTVMGCVLCSGEHPYAQVGANSVLDAAAYEFTHGYGNHRTSVQ